MNCTFTKKRQENVYQQSPQVFLQFFLTHFLWQFFLFFLHLLFFHLFLHVGGTTVVVVVVVIWQLMVSSVAPKYMHEMELLIEGFVGVLFYVLFTC